MARSGEGGLKASWGYFANKVARKRLMWVVVDTTDDRSSWWLIAVDLFKKMKTDGILR